MDGAFNNVLEGTRQYFMGVPKQVQGEGSGQPVWPASTSPPEEGTPAQSGAPAATSRPPSTAAAPPAPSETPPMAVPAPPRPPSEPIEPEPHIIHKATVMREAAEKRREMPDIEDEEEPGDTLSPPSHIIRKPPQPLPSPAPAQAAPSPSPVRPPSVAPPAAVVPEPQPELLHRAALHCVQTPTSRPAEHFAQSRPPDPYSSSRPPESYRHYPYETNGSENSRNSHVSIASPQPVLTSRNSPQTYARLSSSVPQHAANRLREAAVHSSPAQRYAVSMPQPPPPHNDRVPPIHHPQTPPLQKLTSGDVRSVHLYPPIQHRRESSPYTRPSSQFDRHPTVPPRKYDPQQAYSGYRQATPQPLQNQRIDTHHQVPYKHAIDLMNSNYSSRPSERSPVPVPQAPHSHDATRLSSRMDYHSISRPVDSRSSYPYATSGTTALRYAPGASLPATINSTPASRSPYRTPVTHKTNYDYATSNSVQSSSVRSSTKAGYPNQQTRMTVSVTSIVNQMNQTKQKQESPITGASQVNHLDQTKQKRESPLDLSVKTVKNSADSSTTQDDAVDSASVEGKILHALQPRPSSSRQAPPVGYTAAHKVDFAPNFTTQYGERSTNVSYNPPTPQLHNSVRYNGTYDSRRLPETYPVESSHVYAERSKYGVSVARADYVPRIDITRASGDPCPVDNRIRDDRTFIIEERKRPQGPIVSNIPDKIVRYETWSSDSRIDRTGQSAVREQHELMRQPVYNYSSHKQFEAYQNEQKRSKSSAAYRDRIHHPNHGYPSGGPYPEIPSRDLSQYHALYQDRNTSVNARHHVIQRIPSHREVHSQHVDPNRVPADKRVLSILRNSLETKQSGFSDASRPTKQIPELIVIDDVDDSVIDIDLTKDNDHPETKKPNVTKSSQAIAPNSENHNIQMPKAVDSLPRDSEYHKLDNTDLKRKTPENDVARIRTKAELKVMPPSQDSGIKSNVKHDLVTESDGNKLLPKSQKQHLFNQIRKDNLRFESVIRSDNTSEALIPDVKSEPMNIEEIERDAEISIKTEHLLENLNPERGNLNEDKPADDLDWASACDSFVEQLKSGCHKKKNTKKLDETDNNNESKLEPEETSLPPPEITITEPEVVVKQEPIDEDEIKPLDEPSNINVEVKIENIKDNESTVQHTILNKNERNNPKSEKGNKNATKPEKSKKDKKIDKEKPVKTKSKSKSKLEKNENNSSSPNTKKDKLKTFIKEESESTDDDEPLIKSKILKDKEQSERLKHQLLKDLSEKSAYVKLECCDVDVNKNNRKSLDYDSTKGKEEKQNKGKLSKTKTKGKSLFADNTKNEKQIVDSSTDSDDEKLSVASRLRMRKSVKNEDKVIQSQKTTPSKKIDSTSSASSSSTPIRKPDFGDGSAFHPGWEEELYRYKRSLRMPSRLIAIPRGRSGGPFVRKTGVLLTRGSTSLPDLDPAPLSPAPSSAPSAATDDLYARRPDKMTLDSDLDSNSSCSAPNRLHYDSEASTSTVFSSSKPTRKSSSIVDVLIQKCGKKEDNKKKSKEKDDKTPKVIQKTSNTTELLPTPSLGLLKNSNKGTLSAKKEKLMEEIYYLGAFRKETVSAFRNAFIKNTDGLIGATEEFAPVVLKSRTRTESRVLKQRATIKEVFGDERPASAPPTSCRDDIDLQEGKDDIDVASKPIKEPDPKAKLKPKKIIKDKLKRRSSSIRDGLRSTKSLKRNDAKGRLLRLKKRNNLIKCLNNKRIKEISNTKQKPEGTSTSEEKEKPKEEGSSLGADATNTKRRFKRLFGRRKFSSGFDYIRKKKKIIRREDSNNKIRRPAVKPSPESIHDIHKEIKSWFINKSIGETHLHRAARLGYTDCVAYCLEKMESDPSAKDNAGFTPLHVAAAKGHVPIARLLLQYGANVSAAAQGGIRPLHEACENCHVEVIRLLLAYGADPLLGTYAGQTPEELTEGQATKFLRLHIADVQGQAIEPWRFPPPTHVIDYEEIGCDPLSSPPPASPAPPPDATIEIQCTEAPLPPFYSLKNGSGQPSDGLWCLLQDITNLLQIKSKDSLLKQIHCGSGSPKELLREIRTQEFLERAQCHQLICAGEKVNIRASKVALIRVTDKLRQLLKIETVLVS